MTTAAALDVRTIDTHPRVLEIRAAYADSFSQLEAARTERERIIKEREELNDASVNVLVRLGKLKASDVSSAAERHDRDVDAANVAVAKLESIVEHLALDCRGVIQEASLEIQQWAQGEAREALLAIGRSLADVDRKIVELGGLRRHGIQTPGTLAVISGFATKFRDEARARFGVRFEP